MELQREAAWKSRTGKIGTCLSPQGIAEQTCWGGGGCAGGQAGEVMDQAAPCARESALFSLHCQLLQETII